MTQKTIDDYRQEYIGAIFGAAAYASAAATLMYEAIDMMQERKPQLIRHEVKHIINTLVGNHCQQGLIDKVRANNKNLMSDNIGMAWTDDFAIRVYNQIEDDIMRLHNAIANALGRYPKVPDINICAKILLAQSLAKEQAMYVERHAKKLGGFSITTRRNGYKENVATVLHTLSYSGVEKNLARLARLLLEPNLPEDVNLAEDATVKLGVKALFQRLADVQTWITARDEADVLNGLPPMSNE